jgi:ADP-dependent NAD(P)H-hydrate dehydratase / NAD(P)H-hydrate epimerase
VKILERKQIAAADRYTIENEPIASIDLMERASSAFCLQLIQIIPKSGKLAIICGKGNNGGDGLAASRILLEKGYKVSSFIVHYSDTSSPDFITNLQRLKKQAGSKIIDLHEKDALPDLSGFTCIIDALWGTGLTRPIQGFAGTIIRHINNSGKKIIALDIASGTFCDDYNKDENKIEAKYSISFYPPKLSFFFPENEKYLGNWYFVDIGLNRDFIEKQDSPFQYQEEQEIKNMLKKRNVFDHKGKFGHVLIIAGSYGKAGAAVLAAHSALRSGAGLVSAYIPRSACEIMQASLPECMCIPNPDANIIAQKPNLEPYTSLTIGPGLGTAAQTAHALKEILSSFKKALVLDADALNLIALNPDMWDIIPENSILTPHIGEFERLAGFSENHKERLEKMILLTQKYKVIMVLKGAFTAIASPEGKIFFNPTGNPGMATGGSGDVLSGIISSLLAQNYPPIEAARLGVYLHGLAGDLAAAHLGYEALIAGDIIDHLAQAFQHLHA